MAEPVMSAMEKSLRRALEAGDPTDPAFRESIYSASERALERMLAGKGLDDGAAHAQRTRLAETINRIEDEFYERQTAAGFAEDGPAQHDPELSLDPAYADVHAYAAHPADEIGDAAEDARDGEVPLHPVFGETEGRSPHGGPVAMAVGAPDGEDEVEEPVRPSPRARGMEAEERATARSGAQLRRFLVIGLVAAVILAVCAWLVLGGASASGTAAEATGPRWIELFDGRRLDAVATPTGGRMEAMDESGTGQAGLRFTPAASGDSVMTVAVGRGVLPDIRGRSVTVEVTAGSPDGAARSFAIRCVVDGADRCGRQVFTTARASESFAFDLALPPGASGGRFEIAPMPATDAAALDLYAIRLNRQTI
ncbi:hypothetical protein GCM10011390_12160 [Aureimonas endophytica]|uniref:Uncharacterized protein n=1 Tax=Aureimonas endophytica TaxID=2027858 RepID=A0A917E235_9HYPH|nr:hypothetical protein [Aureimonas endophytica]GGD94977.1 hypothetical protein GCM10011390_12160 [Aureimonas endophytica]